MHPLAAPILAQVLTLTAGNRDELRWVADRNFNELQAEARLLAGASRTFRHGSLGLRYAPSVIMAPLEEKPRTISFLNSISGDARGFWNSRRSTFQLSETAEVSQRNLVLQAYAAPAPASPANTQPATGGPTPPDMTPPPTNTARSATPPAAALPGTVLFGTSRSDITFVRQLSHASAFASGIDYVLSGGLDKESQATYPLLQGPAARLSLLETLSHRDSLTSTVDATYTLSSRGERALFTGGNELLAHQFSPRTRGTASAGLVYTWLEPAPPTPDDNQPARATLGKLYPVGTAEIVYAAPYATGNLFARAAGSYQPTLDPVAVTIDPRFTIILSAGWSRHRFAVTAAANTTLSLKPSAVGGLDSTSASATASYELGSGCAVEGGGRLTWQVFQGKENIPPTGILFAAFSWTATLNRH